MKDLSKHYRTLRAHERFQLAIKAMAREDEADADALRLTCPRKTYEMLDAAVTDRFDALMRLVAAHLMGMEATKGKVMIHGVTQDLLEHLMNQVEDAVQIAYHRGFSDGGGKGRPPKAGKEMTDTQTQGLRELVDRMLGTIRRGIMARAKADLEAFEAVCRERLGLDSQTVLTPWGHQRLLGGWTRPSLRPPGSSMARGTLICSSLLGID